MPRCDKPMCMICNELCTDIDTHINECINNLIIKKKNTNYLLKINDATNTYWMFVVMNGNLKLSKLDNFLKDTWLECCGHLSKFTINDKEYGCDNMSYDTDEENNNMDHKIKDILEEDVVFTYEYDFGSTTELFISVIKIFNSKNNKILIVSQNSNPKYKCNICKKFNSVKICLECQNTFCNKCTSNKKHTCDPDDECIFDLINSPRMADCFYMSGVFADSD